MEPVADCEGSVVNHMCDLCGKQILHCACTPQSLWAHHREQEAEKNKQIEILVRKCKLIDDEGRENHDRHRKRVKELEAVIADTMGVALAAHFKERATTAEARLEQITRVHREMAIDYAKAGVRIRKLEAELAEQNRHLDETGAALIDAHKLGVICGARLEELEAENKRLERWESNVVQDRCEGAYVETTLMDVHRQALHEVVPDHPLLHGKLPSFGVWETMKQRVEKAEANATKAGEANAILRELNEGHIAQRGFLEARAEKAEAQLRDLLATIHRDGGHHTGAVGIEQSVKDACLVYYALRTEVEKYET